MNQQFSPPPYISIRRAIAKDQWEIKSLLLTWDDSHKTIAKNFYMTLASLGFVIMIGLYSWFLAVLLIVIYCLCEYTFKPYRNFWVINIDDTVLGCAELRVKSQYSLLFNVCIKRKYRHQKLGSYLIEHLIRQNHPPIYLACYRELIPFYTRFGFTTISPNKLPIELQMSLGLNKGAPITPMVLY